MNNVFRAIIGLQQSKWNVHRFPIYFLFSQIASLIVRVVHLLQLMNLHWYIIITQTLAYVKVQSWCCILCGYGQMSNDMYALLWFKTEVVFFLLPYQSLLLCLLILISAPQTLANHWSFYCLPHFAFSRMP